MKRWTLVLFGWNANLKNKNIERDMATYFAIIALVNFEEIIKEVLKVGF